MEQKVSIFIICYNQSSFIEDTMRSALEQDYDNLEVIVADDGSEDGTVDLIRQYAQRYPRRLVPLVDGPHLGITGNCNRALSACRGTYIASLGGDDILLPGKIKRQVEWLDEDRRRVLCGHDVRVVYTGIVGEEHIRGDGGAGRHGVGAQKIIKYGVGSFFKGTSMMWRSDSMPHWGFDERLAVVSDWKFIVDIVRMEGIWGSIDGVYAIYRRHHSNVTLTSYDVIMKQSLETLQLLEQAYPCFRREIAFARLEYLYNLMVIRYRAAEYGGAFRASWLLLGRSHPRVESVTVVRLFMKSLLKGGVKRLFGGLVAASRSAR